MPDPSSNSFIPKRGPASRPTRGATTRRVYIFTIISYVLLFATLLASGGMFLYGKYLDKQLAEEVKKLDSEIKSFSVAKMEEVLEFEKRLREATDRIERSASVASIFRTLEATTVDTVMIESLSLERAEDDIYTLTAAVLTDSFDSTISQRGVFQRDQVFQEVSIEEVQATPQDTNDGRGESGLSLVTFSAVFEVPVTAIPYRPTSQPAALPVITSEAVLNTTSDIGEPIEGTVEEESANEDQI